jgi:hypothetical protein
MNWKKKIFFLGLVLGISSFFVWKMVAPRNHCEIPIQFLGVLNTAYTTLEIEGKPYFLDFDLGMMFPVSLKKEVLEKMKKEPWDTISWKDFKGIQYQTPTCIIPRARLGRSRFKNLWTHETSKDFEKNNIFFGEKDSHVAEDLYDSKLSGSLGAELFLMANIPALFLDLGNSRAFMVKNIRRFHEGGYSCENFLKVPLEKKENGLCIQVETDIGKKSFSLDTGSSENLLSASLFPDKPNLLNPDWCFTFTSSKLIIGDRDFGKEEFRIYDIKLEGIDGALGMPFFKKYAIFLDFQNNVAYISPSRKK